MARLIEIFVINLVIFLTTTTTTVRAQAEFDEEICLGYDDGELFQIQGTCTKYYYCVDQVGYIDDCTNFGEDYQFDPAINDCNLADQVGCIEDDNYVDYPEETDPPITDAPATRPPVVVDTTTQLAIQTTIASTTSIGIPDVQCPTDKPGELIFLASLDCSEYYICSNGRQFTMKCMDGFVWNPDENQCDHPVFNPRCSVIIILNYLIFGVLTFSIKNI